VGGQDQAPAALPQGKRHDTHCRAGWVGCRPSLDGYRISHCHRDSIPRLSSL